MSESLIGIFFAIYNDLRDSFLESFRQKALALRSAKNGTSLNMKIPGDIRVPCDPSHPTIRGGFSFPLATCALKHGFAALLDRFAAASLDAS